MTMLPEAVAVRVPPDKGTVACPIFKVPVAPLVRVEAPANAVETVKVPSFCVVPLMVKLGIATVPEIVFEVPLMV